MACMQVADLQHDAFEFRACIIRGFQEPHPHVVCVVIDDKQEVAHAMCGWDIHKTSDVLGEVPQGVGWFRASNGAAGCSSGLVEQT
jgi:hypothetical protein